jgi:hypothetical protein
MNLLDYPVSAAIGALLAIAVASASAMIGLSRERGFYALMTIVVASYYVLFALVAGALPVLLAETAIMFGFSALAVGGYKRSDWLVVLALAGHALFDAGHGSVIANPGVPLWWPACCLTFDVAMAVIVAIACVTEGLPRPSVA